MSLWRLRGIPEGWWLTGASSPLPLSNSCHCLQLLGPAFYSKQRFVVMVPAYLNLLYPTPNPFFCLDRQTAYKAD